MPVEALTLTTPRAVTAIAMAGACTGLALGGMIAAGAGGAGAPHPATALRQAFDSPAPDLRPRFTPSFSWAFLLPRPPRRLVASARDLECLTDAVYYEARGEPSEGQAAVAQVVLNRTRRPGFPKTVCGVVFQRAGRACQFSFACDGSVTRYREAAAWSRARRVAGRALGGYQLAEVGGATHFHVAGLRAGWGAGLAQVAQIGAHVFYAFGRPQVVPVRSVSTPVAAPAVLTLAPTAAGGGPAEGALRGAPPVPPASAPAA